MKNKTNKKNSKWEKLRIYLSPGDRIGLTIKKIKTD